MLLTNTKIHLLGKCSFRGPWLYQDFPLLVAEYDGKSSLADFPVNSMAVWVRVMDIPPGMMNEKWARKMGDQLGTYKEIPKENKK
jgi:hypothetical protein